VAGVVYANLKVVATTLGGIRIKRRLGDLEISEKLPEKYISIAVGTMSILLGLWFGASIPRSIGLGVLFLTTGTSWGIADPVMGQDLLFYMLTLPVVSAFVTFGMVLIFLCVSLSAAGYAATGALSWGDRNLQVEAGPRKHLAVLGTVFFGLLAVRFFLQRYFLLLGGNSSVENIFGYTDAMAGLPGLRILAVLSAFTAAGALWSGLKGRVLPFLVTFGGLVVGGLIAAQLYPAFVQRFQVEPNELARETPYIGHAIEYTKIGYDLDELERRPFASTPETDDFAGVTIDRYERAGGPTPVALSVREVDPGGIEDPNWQNLHLRPTFVAGMGAVASAANTKTAEGRPNMYLSDIPVQFDSTENAPGSLRLERPAVYIGSMRSRMQPYAIINPEEHRSPEEGPGTPGVDFPSGIHLDSNLRKLALSWYFQDLNLLFAAEVTGSRSRKVCKATRRSR